MDNEEKFWKGQFGNDYTARNINLVENNYQMFKKIFELKTLSEDIKSIIEFGCGTAMNLQALQRIFPNAVYEGWEINNTAIQSVANLNKNINIIPMSMLDCDYKNRFDLVLSKGLLIHIHPDNIQKAYDVLYNASNKYILLCEYYNPVLCPVIYHGNDGKLWKRDFAGEMIKRYSDLKLLDYGFVYHEDKYPQDDITWFLLSKKVL